MRAFFHSIAGLSTGYCVEGRLAENWSDRLGGMVITHETSIDGHPVSNLMGELSDQASLVGVLNTLYDLHYPVFLVERLKAGENAVSESAK